MIEIADFDILIMVKLDCFLFFFQKIISDSWLGSWVIQHWIFFWMGCLRLMTQVAVWRVNLIDPAFF